MLCGRNQDEVPGFRYLGPAEGDHQWGLYRAEGDPAPVARLDDGTTDESTPTVDWETEAASLRNNITPFLLKKLARSLGVSSESLDSFGVGYERASSCWTFPERDETGAVVGINRRHPDGTKRMIKGSNRGLVYREEWQHGDCPILCVEGASDTAALLTLGVTAIGRPSNTGGVKQLAGLLATVPDDREIVIVGENDKKDDGSWPGRDGAVATTQQLAQLLGRDVHYAFPPDGEKDVRSWLHAQEPDLDDEVEVDELGEALVDAILSKAVKVVGWEPLLEFENPELPEFPTSTLPSWLAEFVHAVSVSTQTPPDLAGMLVLAVLAVALARRIVVEVRTGYREPVNIFAVVAQPPASRKSSVFAEVSGVLREFEQEAVRESLPIIAAARNHAVIEENQLKRLQKQASNATGPDAETASQEAEELAERIATTLIPDSPRLVTDDTTAEGLASLLVKNQGRLAVLSPEGGVFGNIAGRYGNGKQPANFEVYLKGHAGDPLRVDRVGRPPEYVDRPALTLGLTVQPDVIKNLANDPSLRGRGLLGRFLYSMPRSRVGHRLCDPPPVPNAIRDRYERNVRLLLDLSSEVGQDGAPIENVVRLSHAAHQSWIGFSQWLEPQLAEFEPLAHIGDWAGKLAGAVARIAGLLHAADMAGGATPWSRPIPARTMDRAIELGEYLIPHARAAYEEMGADPTVAAAKHVLAWIRKQGESNFTKKTCFEAKKGRFRTVEALNPALALLVRHGHIKEKAEASVTRGPGRPPSPTYEVNPATLATRPAPTPRRGLDDRRPHQDGSGPGESEPATATDDTVASGKGKPAGARSSRPRGGATPPRVAEPVRSRGNGGDFEEIIL